MSQANGNPLISFSNFDGAVFVNQQSHFDVPFPQQWILSDPSIMGPSISSPTGSIQSPWTTTLQRSPSAGDVRQHSASMPYDRIDPSLQDLLLDASVAYPSSIPNNADPLARMNNDPPWSVLSTRTPIAQNHRSGFNQPNGPLRAYRDGPKSDIDSNFQRTVDEGYYTATNPSVLSREPSRTGQEVPEEIRPVANLDVSAESSEAANTTKVQSDQRSVASFRSGKSAKCITCTLCGETSKCSSEYKKHELRHLKPFTCDFADCKRGIQGFTTTNDLERHKKSVHRVNLGPGCYQCASGTCRNPAKIWPRLDNFKQHLERMHPGEDAVDLINRSVYQAKESTSKPESLTVAPLDTSYFIGMDRSLSSHSGTNIRLTMELSPDMSSHRRSSFGNTVPSPMNDIRRASGDQNVYMVRTPSTASQNSLQRVDYRQEQWRTVHAQQTLTVPTERPAQAASGIAIVSEQSDETRIKLSDAPQTKSEQQRSALRKLSNAIASKALSDPSNLVDLEDMILSVLHQANDSVRYDREPAQQAQNSQHAHDGTKAVQLTKIETRNAVHAMSNLLKQSPGSSNRSQRRSTQGFVSNSKKCPVESCDYTVARDCDLRKHMKRHNKPYGCTYPKCYKRFGAKSDWKRHENSQHFQLEAWRCSRPPEVGAACGQHFFRQAQFQAHLQGQHNMSSSEDITEATRSNRIGKNCQVRFWCGFCNVIVELKNKRNAAWDERFDHIAHHFDREKKSIDKWICVEENKAKQDLCKGMDRYVFDDDDERDVDAQGEVDDDVLLPSSMDLPIGVPSRGDLGPPPPPSPQSFTPGNGRKRGAPADPSAPQRYSKRRGQTMVCNTYCCACHGAFGSFDVACPSSDCRHQKCSQCPGLLEPRLDDMFDTEM